MKRIHDSPNGAEEADKGSRAGGGGEHRQGSLKALDLRPHGPFEGAVDTVEALQLERFAGLAVAPNRAHLCLEFGIAGLKHPRKR